MKKFAKLTAAQMALARRIEAAGITTLSQVLKALERNETAKVEAWKEELVAKADSQMDLPVAPNDQSN